MVLILLRNLNPRKGLCNGTRLILHKALRLLLECTLASEGNRRSSTEKVLIPRIELTTDKGDFLIQWKRRQFPVRPAFAMTINKSQGQTFQRVGLWLKEPCFSHGQFYVACSRVGTPEAPHQSTNNSGVIHAGIYYAPGSLKAKLCVRGLDLSYEYCDKYNVPYNKCGKLIVAVTPEELPRLDTLFDRAQQNGCRDLEMIDGARIKEFEPHCKGLRALWSPHTGIIDWGMVTQSFGTKFQEMGGKIFHNFKVTEFRMIPEHSKAGKENLFPLTLIAEHTQVPDPRFPFLGVHFTPRMNGDMWLGPNAVLAFKREGYKYTDINLKDLFESVSFKGMRKLILKYFAFGAGEMYRSFRIGAQVKLLQRFVPELKLSDVTRGPSGVRAQALDADGTLVDDFVFDSGSGELGSRLLHVRNAPSPAATSSLAIAEMVADKGKEKFGLS